MSINPVGTPDYIAPELLQILSTKGNQTSNKLDVSFNFVHYKFSNVFGHLTELDLT